ncbi:MAG: tRNA (guanine(37)-N(1))-methyltransferase [Patescibacteria group bacterium]|jgi:tRNA (guanine37-N1)-methyltransferase
MNITVLTLFPEVVEPFLHHSIINRAVEKGLVTFNVVQLRDFAHDKHKTVDDHPFGGGAGMLLKIEPLVEAIEHIEKQFGKAYKIALSPKGTLLTQSWARDRISHLESRIADLETNGTDQMNDARCVIRDHVLLICGHYEGFDARIVDYIDEELSIGNYVLSSGEAAAMVVIDALVRLIPGVLKKEDATVNETFFEIDREELFTITHDPDLQTDDSNPTFTENCKLKTGNSAKISLLEYPQYTLPREFRGKKVPDVLISGDPKKIREWQIQEAWKETKKKA